MKKIFTAETRRKISEAHKGLKHSEETKIKMRQSHKKRPIVEIKQCGKIQKWESQNQAKREAGYNTSAICECYQYWHAFLRDLPPRKKVLRTHKKSVWILAEDFDLYKQKIGTAT